MNCPAGGRLLQFADVIVSPYSDLIAAPRGGVYHRGGPAWPDWDQQVEARHRVSGRVVDDRPEPIADAPRLHGTFAWAGAMMPHFGHQLADFSMRIVPTLAEWPDATFLYATDAALPVTSVANAPAFFGAILAWFGVPLSRVRLVTRPQRVSELVVAAQAEQVTLDAARDTGPSAEHLDAMDELTVRRLGTLERHGTTYVSRAGQHARMAGEAYLEQQLQEAGVTVIRPETLLLRDQARAYATAEHLIFAAGSAIHGAQLLGRSLGHVSVLQRRNDWKVARHPLEPRAQSFTYLEASLGQVHGADETGQIAAYRGLTILDEEELLEGLAGVGVRLEGWQSAAFAAARDADVIEWARRELSTPRGDVPEARAYLFQSMEATGLGHLHAEAARIQPGVSGAPGWSDERGGKARLRRAVSGRLALKASGHRAPAALRRNALARSFFGHPLFDAEWYADRYPDIRESGTDPLPRLPATGAREGRSPNAFFDTAWYVERNPDAAGMKAPTLPTTTWRPAQPAEATPARASPPTGT